MAPPPWGPKEAVGLHCQITCVWGIPPRGSLTTPSSELPELIRTGPDLSSGGNELK